MKIALWASPIAAALMLMITPSWASAQTAPSGTAMINGLMWATESNGEDIGLKPAREYCDKLTLAGHSDWRLPTLAELEALYDAQAAAQNYIKSPLKLGGCCLWSSTTLADIPRNDTFYVEGIHTPEEYGWGYLFAEEPLRYYSYEVFPDGQALCVRNV